MELLQNLFCVMAEFEVEISKIAKKINPHDFFDELNFYDKDHLREDDFCIFFREKKFYFLKEDLKFILHRFDSDSDGRISYHEFIANYWIYSFFFLLLLIKLQKFALNSLLNGKISKI